MGSKADLLAYLEQETLVSRWPLGLVGLRTTTGRDGSLLRGLMLDALSVGLAQIATALLLALRLATEVC